MTDRLVAMSVPAQRSPEPTRSRVLKAVEIREHLQHHDHQASAALAERSRRAQERQVAYDEGVAAGRVSAEADGAAAVPRLVDTLAALMGQAESERKTATANAAQNVLSAAVTIAEWIVGAHLNDNAQALVKRLQDAAALVVISSPARLSVSPADVEAASQWAAAHPGLVVIGDPTLSAGEARLNTAAGEADLTVAVALQRAAQALGVVAP